MQYEQSASQGPGFTILSSAADGPVVPGLEDLSGRVRFDVEREPFVTLNVHDGRVEPMSEREPVAAIVRCKTEGDALRLLRGEASPVVLALQGRIEELEGDLGFATRVLLGLQAASPFRTVSG